MTPPNDVVRAVEAVLFAAADPMTIDSIRAYVGGGDVRHRGADAGTRADGAKP